MTFIVSVHIPKTAGTTLATVFERSTDRRVIFDYSRYADPQLPDPHIVAHRDFVQNYFVFLHGHFYAQKYFTIFPNASYISAVRHPVERVISQYLHELNDNASEAWFHADIVERRMDVVEFSGQPGIGDAMALHLAGRELKDYDLILISEHLVESLAILSMQTYNLHLDQHFGVPPRLPRHNEKSVRSLSVDISESQRRAIFNLTAQDNETYIESEELFRKKCTRYLR